MVGMAELESMNLANQLIRIGLRLSIVRSMTHLGTRILRQWWKEAHGVSPVNGKLPESVLSFIKDKSTASRLSAFAGMHQLIYGTELTAKSLLTTWREFQEICGPLDINAAYFAARDVKARIVVLSRCPKCNATYIYDAGSKHTDHCPFCDSMMIPS